MALGALVTLAFTLQGSQQASKAASSQRASPATAASAASPAQNTPAALQVATANRNQAATWIAQQKQLYAGSLKYLPPYSTSYAPDPTFRAG